MKVSSFRFPGLTAAVVGLSSLVLGSNINELEHHIAQLETEAKVLSTENTAKDAEIYAKDTKIASLLKKLDTSTGCDDGGWTPAMGDSWNYNLATPVKTSADVDVMLIDMDYHQGKIDKLHDQGKFVVCYISIGSVEDWRFDVDDFPAEAIGNDMEGWEGEKWLDVNNEDVKDIMAARVLTAAGMGCDGIDPDNMNVFSIPDSGVDVSKKEQIAYNTWFAETVHASGMKVGLKNCVDLVEDLVDCFDFAVNESCNVYDECYVYIDTFLAQGKPVYNVEYTGDLTICEYTNDIGMDTIFKNKNLKAFFCSCVDPSRDLSCSKVI